ncbi:hypothetical protein [Paraburkholderia sp. GAS32]|uniref:hypothetical protein n=1 Tax=Paraburkholderia sp. GAS32 TaxID=3035129 RepID=UPI003D218869
MKEILKVVTPVGTFTRETATPYKFAKVWAAPRFRHAFESGATVGKPGHWTKNKGYEVTFHQTREAAEAAKCKWVSDATLIGVFPVSE